MVLMRGATRSARGASAFLHRAAPRREKATSPPIRGYPTAGIFLISMIGRAYSSTCAVASTTPKVVSLSTGITGKLTNDNVIKGSICLETPN